MSAKSFKIEFGCSSPLERTLGARLEEIVCRSAMPDDSNPAPFPSDSGGHKKHQYSINCRRYQHDQMDRISRTF